MFTLTKETNTTNAGEIKIGNAFHYEGEICVRIKTPKNPPVDANKVLAISVETWELRQIDPSLPVEMIVIHATSRPMGHAD